MYKQSAAILALFLGSSQAINLGHHHHHHHHPRHYQNIGVRFLDAEKFAEGYGVGEKMDESIIMNGPEKQETYKFAQQNQGVRFLNQKAFAEGYAVGEKMDESIIMNGPEKQETYKFAQQGNEFAAGYGDREEMGETIRSTGPERFIKTTYVQLEDPVAWQGKGVAFPPKPPTPGFVGVAAATAGNVNKKGADGKEAIIDAQESEKFADEATEKANTRLPYASTLLQVEDPVAWQGAGVKFPPVPPAPGFIATAVGTAGNVNKKGADGKEAIIDAQDSEKFADEATDKANTRLPYASTLLQLEDPVAWQGAGVKFPPVPPVPGFVATAAATAPNTDKKGADGKEAIIDAQDSEQFADDATNKANTRLPYASTLLQLRDDDPSKMESIEESNVPLNFHFIHIATEEGELIRYE